MDVRDLIGRFTFEARLPLRRPRQHQHGRTGARGRSEKQPPLRRAALKAVALDDTLAEAHAVLGRILGFERDWHAAGRELRRALELDPNSADGLRSYAVYLARRGRFDEALTEARRAWEIEPGAANSIVLCNFSS